MYCRAIDDSLQVSAEPGGDTGAPQVKVNPIDRGIYHTDWVADRTIAWLDSLDADDDWFCWMSFPDPHHPWDPPESEMGRVDWREVPLPAGYPEDRSTREADHRRQAPPLAGLVRRHPGLQLRGPGRLGPGHADRRPGPRGQRPQRRRGRADRRGARPGAGPGGRARLGRRRRRGLHHRPRRAPGRLRPAVQGPVPRGRPHAAPPGVAPRPVGPGRRAGRTVGRLPARSAWSTWPPRSAPSPASSPPEWMQGTPLPVDDADADARGFDKVLTEWDSELFGTDVHLRTMMRDRWVVTAYRPGTSHDGTEGELYDLVDDPLQQVNRWDDPDCRAAARRPGGRPVGLPARGPGRPAVPRSAGVSRAADAGYWTGPWPGEDGGPRRLGVPADDSPVPTVHRRHGGGRGVADRPPGHHGGHPRSGRGVPPAHTAWAPTPPARSSGSTPTPLVPEPVPDRWPVVRCGPAASPPMPTARCTWCSATTPTGCRPTSRSWPPSSCPGPGPTTAS